MARSKSFDYPHTCPTIDKEIDRCKSSLEDGISDIIIDVCPYIPSEVLAKISREKSSQLFESISNYFETVRESNQDIRGEACRKIDSLISEIEDLKSVIQDLERESNSA